MAVGSNRPAVGVLMSVLLMETFRNTLFAHLYVCQRFTANPEPISLGFNCRPLPLEIPGELPEECRFSAPLGFLVSLMFT